jgi:hypothetical protein
MGDIAITPDDADYADYGKDMLQKFNGKLLA